MLRQRTRREYLARHEQMPQIGPGMIPARPAIARRVQWPPLTRIHSLLDRDWPPAGEGRAVARIARRQDAIKHVETHRTRGELLGWRADIHQIAVLAARQHRGRERR